MKCYKLLAIAFLSGAFFFAAAPSRGRGENETAEKTLQTPPQSETKVEARDAKNKKDSAAYETKTRTIHAAMNFAEPPLLPFALVGFAGFNINMHGADFSIVPGYGGYGSNFTNGYGYGLAVGAGAEYYPNKQLYGLKYNLGGLLLFSTFSGLLSKDDFVGNVIQGNSSSRGIVETTINSSISAAFVEPYIAVYPLKEMPISIKFGAQAGIPLSASMTRRESLIAPEDVSFETETRFRKEKSGSIPDKSSFYAAGVISLRYDASLSRSIALIPEASYSLAFTGASSSLSWKTNAARVGFSIAMRPSEIPPITLRPEEPRPVPEKRIKKLEIAARLKVNGIARPNGENIKIPILKTRIITRRAIAPILYFAPNSDHITQPDNSGGELNSQSYVLEGIAEYLKANPNAKITITVYYADDETQDIAQKRGSAIVEMLSGKSANYGNISVIQGNAPLKLRRPDLRDEMRKATFAIDGGSRVFYIIKEKTTSKVERVIVEAAPEFTASELPAQVEGALIFDGKKVAELDGGGSKYEIDAQEMLKDDAEKILSADYSIVDSAGDIKKSAITVNIQPVVTFAEDAVNRDEKNGFEQCLLGYFDFDSYGFSSVDSLSLDRVRKAVKNGKQIEIIGLTDDLGSEDYNKKLAAKRIETALSLINTAEDKVKTILLAPIFPKNDTPASRTMNRSVVVRIY